MPESENTFKNYIKDKNVAKKCYAKVQIHMYVTGIKKCLFCLAHWDFHKNNEVAIIVVNFDNDYVVKLVNSLISFWKVSVYPLLERIKQHNKWSLMYIFNSVD